jgi:hypothetical protein
VVGQSIRATGDLDQPPQRVYAFLADLRNHWRLSRRFVEFEQLDGGSRVTLAADVERASLLDRAILRHGFAEAVEQLGREA